MTEILYLTYDGLTDPLGQSQILPYLFGLNKRGYQFTIISFEKQENKSQMEYIQNLLNEQQIDWYPLTYSKRPPVLSTLYDLLKLKRLSSRLHRDKTFSIVHCRSYLTSLIGLELKRRHNLKFIFDMRGFWADERIDGKIWTLSNPIYRLIYQYFKNIEQVFLQESSYTISLTEAGRKIIEDKIVSGNAAPIKVIPCCVDTTLFDAQKVQNTSNLKGELCITDQFILGYVGSIGTWYMLPEMASFFKELLKKIPDAVFLFVTKEPKTILQQAFNRANIPLDHLRVVGSSRELMPSYISLFNWSIFFIKPTFSKQASSPTKQGEIMSMNIPIICNAGVGDTDAIIKKYNAGVIIQEMNHFLGVDQLLSFSKQQMHSRKGSEEYFSLNKGINSYLSVYEYCLSL